MIKALFLHGGPGLNSEAERRILAPILSAQGFDFTFWNEPSHNRPEGHAFQKDRAFSGWLESIEAVLREQGPFELLVGSSFGALAALHLLARGRISFARFVMLSPTLDLLATFHKMMDLAVRDFSGTEPSKAAALLELQKRSRSFFDGPTRQAMELVYQDPLLLGHYWVDHEILPRWASVLSEPRFGLDRESQNAVLAEMASTPETHPLNSLRGIHAMLMVGARDPVRDDERNLGIARPFLGSIERHVFAKSGHFPHLEEPEAFADTLKAFCAKD
jgi:pimeloyl-ACP methyl ester carboxylesterase